MKSLLCAISMAKVFSPYLGIKTVDNTQASENSLELKRKRKEINYDT
jgi:hypothetical protein